MQTFGVTSANWACPVFRSIEDHIFTNTTGKKTPSRKERNDMASPPPEKSLQQPLSWDINEAHRLVSTQKTVDHVLVGF